MKYENNPYPQNVDWPGLDFVKFSCVLIMVLIHVFWYLSTAYGHVEINRNNILFKVVKNTMLIGLFPLMIPVTAGCILRIKLKLSDGHVDRADFIKICTGSIFIGLIGFIMNGLCSGWGSFFSWNVLQLVGLSFIVITCMLTRLSVYAVYISGAICLFSSNLLRQWIGVSDNYLMYILFGDPNGRHAWPFFPWFSLIVCGFIIANFYLVYYKDKKRLNVIFLSIGIVLMLISMIRNTRILPFDPHHMIGPAIFQANTYIMLGVIGFACLFISSASLCFQNHRFSRYGIINCFSKGILWIYVIHLIASARIYELLKAHINMRLVINHPWKITHMVILFGYPLLIFFLSWGVGYITIRYIHDKLIRISVRKI
ncbi:MAG: DUF1624 domain-containing protein [Desulfobacterales bacterium]|nr:DUF1624 domain-containing protein [Desulfobacterales bacterium]